MTNIGIRKPKQMRSMDKCERIKKAFLSIASTKPLSSITTDEISIKANVSIGTLYQFFDNRDSIGVDILEDIIEEQEKSISTGVISKSSILKYLNTRFGDVKLLAPIALEHKIKIIPDAVNKCHQADEIKSRVARIIVGI